MQRFLSLGLSCQSRFAIDSCTAAYLRCPFDFVICTRGFLLEALRSDGASFRHDAADSDTYRMPVEGTEGVHSKGCWFWHDYPVKRDLAPDWREHIPEVNLKLVTLWDRFAEAARDAAVPKRFVLSNTQESLAEFAAGPAQFRERFALDLPFARDLHETMRHFGARNARVTMFVRDLEDYRALAGAADSLPGFDFVFGGVLPLMGEPVLSGTALLDLPGHLLPDGGIAAIAGYYQNGGEIEAIAEDAAILCRHDAAGRTAVGAIRPCAGGFLFVLAEERIRIARAHLQGTNLRLSSGLNGGGLEWRRVVRPNG